MNVYEINTPLNTLYCVEQVEVNTAYSVLQKITFSFLLNKTQLCTIIINSISNCLTPSKFEFNKSLQNLFCLGLSSLTELDSWSIVVPAICVQYNIRTFEPERSPGKIKKHTYIYSQYQINEFYIYLYGYT